MIDRRAALLGLMAAGAASPALAQAAGESTGRLALDGRFVQGGFAVGRTQPGALIFVDGEALTAAGEHGLFVVGFDRDGSEACRIEARDGGFREAADVSVAHGDFPSQTINGLPSGTVDPTDPALIERIQLEAALKQEAYASRDASEHFADGFDWPLETYRVSSRWGAQRVLNGTPARPHYGIDLAAPRGTEIAAPAAGLVVLAEPDLHYEGGTTFIDHGQGLITVYLHQSRLTVASGDRVERGQVIGLVGSSGRATGPHLCWRAKWRDRNIDPSNLVGSLSFRDQR